MVKQVQKRTSKDLKLYIISMIKDAGKLPKDISKSKINYHLKPFIKAGLVENPSYAVWRITDKGNKLLDIKDVQKQKLYTITKTRTFSKKTTIRAHGFRWQLQLPKRAYFSTTQRTKLIQMSKLPCKVLDNGVVATDILGNKTHLANRTINVWINPDVYYTGATAKDSYREASYQFTKIIALLERYYGLSLRINKQYKFKPSAKHFGDLGNELALQYKKDNKSVRIYQNGKEWLIIDFSDSKFAELETTDNSQNIVDMDNIITPFFNTLREDPKIINTLKKENEELKDILNTLQKSVRYLMDKEVRSVNIDTFKY